ncbi:hypothetical protein BC830DRAFT_1135407 [Chytriomyces sp. MP71]|nr:hypothetical protein BC830DRAFT_1135407 [Chytriomyces sp. MP71]
MGKKVIASKEYPKSGETTKQKTVLGTPFEYKWHSLTEGESSMLLTSLVSLLEPVGSKRAAALKTRTDEQAQRRDDERLQLAEAQTTAAENRLKTIKATDLTSLDLAQKEAIRSEQKALEKKLSKKRSSDAPNTPSKRVKLSTDLPPIDDEVCKEIMDSIVLGVNKVTRLLEPQADTSLRLVFVCKGDTTVTHLYSHLPPMVHLAGKGALLVPLPKGAEAALANALGIKSALVLGIKVRHLRVCVFAP